MLIAIAHRHHTRVNPKSPRRWILRIVFNRAPTSLERVLCSESAYEAKFPHKYIYVSTTYTIFLMLSLHRFAAVDSSNSVGHHFFSAVGTPAKASNFRLITEPDN
jgi:hypothetical protein